MSFRKLALAAVALLLPLSGCGDLRYRNGTFAPAESQGRTGQGLLGATDSLGAGTFACPSSPNVVPDYDWAFDGSGFYQVCPHLSSASSMLIAGDTGASATVCAFPANYVSESELYTKPDATGGPQYKCFSVPQGGGQLTFEETNFNSVFIVAKADRSQMTKCLMARNFHYCPAYSFGLFR